MNQKILLSGILMVSLLSAWEINMKIKKIQTIDSLGACQGISIQNGKYFLYGDREVGMIREFSLHGDSLVYNHKECKLTLNGKNIINHPTGIAYNGGPFVFLGNSVRLNKEGTQWKALIYRINWNKLWKTGTLDSSLLNTIEDDACIQGTRPEYVNYKGKEYIATADYGNHGNEVRLYDPEKLKNCKKTSEPGVLFKKFTCTPWVQNLFWLKNKGILVIIQNQIEGRKWRFSFVDLEKSIDEGKQILLKEINIDEKNDELEGFAFRNSTEGIAVSSSRNKNVTFMGISW